MGSDRRSQESPCFPSEILASIGIYTSLLSQTLFNFVLLIGDLNVLQEKGQFLPSYYYAIQVHHRRRGSTLCFMEFEQRALQLLCTPCLHAMQWCHAHTKPHFFSLFCFLWQVANVRKKSKSAVEQVAMPAPTSQQHNLHLGMSGAHTLILYNIYTYQKLKSHGVL